MDNLLAILGRKKPHGFPVLPVAHATECLVFDVEALGAETWKRSRPKSAFESDLMIEWDAASPGWRSRLRESTAREAEVTHPDPVAAGVRAVAPEAARMRTFVLDVVSGEVAAIRKDYDERFARMEAAMAQHFAVSRRADDILARTIASLKAKTGDEADEHMSEEEEARLWQLVDFSRDDDEEG